MNSGPKPPGWALWILRRSLPMEVREDVAGDLVEVFGQRAATKGRLRAQLWYVGQVFSFALHFSWARLRERGPFVNPEASGSALAHFARDLRLAARSARHEPGFSAMVVLTLGLGVGAATAIFSVADAALFKALPFAGAERLVTVTGGVDSPAGFIPRNASYPEFSDWRSDNRTLDGLAAWSDTQATLSGEAGTTMEVLDVEWITADYFEVLEAHVSVGRLFDAAEHAPDGPRAVVVSHRLWRDRFGSNPDLVGQVVRLDDSMWEVVGVAEEGFRGLSFSADVWFPQEAMDVTTQRGRRYLAGIGRLADGATPGQASEDLAGIAAGLEEAFPEYHTDRTTRVVLLRDSLLGATGELLVVLLGAVGGLMLIACVNVANLILVRSSVRSRATLIRRAMGASTRRLFAQAQAEALVLALAGAAVGCGLAVLGVDLLRALIPSDVLPGYVEAGVDLRALAFATVIAVGTGAVIGLVPVIRSLGTDPGTGLREGGSATGGRLHGTWLQPALVSGQVCLALVLLISTGLMVRNLEARLRVDTGMDVDRVAAFRIDLPASRATGDEIEPFLRSVVREIETHPSVERVSWISDIPLSNDNTATSVELEGAVDPDDLVRVYVHRVEPAAFEVLGVSLESGRGIGPDDDRVDDPVVVVSRELAREYYGEEDPVGRRIRFGNTWVRIVGVAEEVRYRDLTSALADGDSPDVFLAYYESLPPSSVGFIIRTRGEAEDALSDIRTVASSALAGVPIQSLAPLSDGIRNVTALSRIGSILFAVFGVLAVTLAAVGIYGVIAVAVGQRNQEIAIRVALGADAGGVLMLVMRQGVVLVGAGVTLGLLGALVASRHLEGFLFGVEATDPLTYLTVCGLLSAVALLATYVPARRATRVEPIRALRSE